MIFSLLLVGELVLYCGEWVTPAPCQKWPLDQKEVYGMKKYEVMYIINESVDEGHIHCPEGYYTVFFPSDIHRPLLAVDDKPIKIRKVVVKVHVSLLGE